MINYILGSFTWACDSIKRANEMDTLELSTQVVKHLDDLKIEYLVWTLKKGLVANKCVNFQKLFKPLKSQTV